MKKKELHPKIPNATRITTAPDHEVGVPDHVHAAAVVVIVIITTATIAVVDLRDREAERDEGDLRGVDHDRMRGVGGVGVRGLGLIVVVGVMIGVAE